jgi:hypothetical protein
MLLTSLPLRLAMRLCLSLCISSCRRPLPWTAAACSYVPLLGAAATMCCYCGLLS